MSPLSPLDESRVNVQTTPMTAHRADKGGFIEHHASSPSKQQSELIDWDDDYGDDDAAQQQGTANSSPFVNDLTASRLVSGHQMPSQDTGNGTEIDAIFEDPATPESAPRKIQRLDCVDDKENSHATPARSSPKKSPFKSPAKSSPMKSAFTASLSYGSFDGASEIEGEAAAVASLRVQGTPRKSASPIKARPTPRVSNRTPSPPASSRPSSRDADAMAMPPPSTIKKAARLASPRKTYNAAIETPLPRSRDASSSTEAEFVEKQCEDLSMAPDADETSVLIDDTNIDDTSFSQFSVLPEMTMFSKLGESAKKSPAKERFMQTPVDEATPRPSRKRPSLDRSPSPTPRRLKTPATDRTNNSFLIDFTQQIERFSNNTHQRGTQRSPTKSSTEPNLLSYLNSQRTPAKRSGRQSTPAKTNSLMNLLDFELPPAPTPRSIPSISVRELESMKSTYQSQISSLTATLTGREAEVESLKKAIADAERRVGESLEAARFEKSKREYAENEKDEWEKRGKEVEKVLHSVKEEVLRSEAEKDDLASQAIHDRRRADEAEARILDLETQLASVRAAVPNADGTVAGVDEDEVQRLVQARIDAKIEAVSRELHAVYKKKHETKVATLKKSYEARSEKKCAELQARVQDLMTKNEELQVAKDDTFSGVLPHDDSRAIMDEQMALINEQKAQLAGLAEEMREVQSQHTRLSQELEQERIEKGELVAAVDEMLLLQTTDGAPAAIEDFRKSIQRPSAPRPSVPAFGAPGAGSRIGKGGPSGLARPSAGKSKMMSNIERMGGGRHD
ncbi:hypothetical protein AAFC00_005957 [Neodothiora populina]